MSNKQKKMDKKLFTRVLCLALAGVMVLTTLVAAVLSQVW